MSELIERIRNDIEKIKVVSSEEKLICNGSFIRLTRGKYYLNNDVVLDRESVSTRISNGNAACIFAVTDDNKILLVIQPRVVLKKNGGINIEIPAGYVENGEDSVTTGKRELLEETGYEAEKIIKMDTYHTSIGFSSETTDLLLALNCKKVSKQKLDKDEVIIVESVTLDEFEYLLKENYILDVNTKIGYYRYLDYLKEGDYNG